MKVQGLTKYTDDYEQCPYLNSKGEVKVREKIMKLVLLDHKLLHKIRDTKKKEMIPLYNRQRDITKHWLHALEWVIKDGN
jgi:hypothetical protein